MNKKNQPVLALHAPRSLADFFSILLNAGLRQAHPSEVLCFLPIAKPV